MSYIICTFYTPNYEYFLPVWSEPLDRWDIPYVAKPMPNYNDWRVNACQKPLVIRQVMDEYPNMNVAWVDIDAVFMKPPVLFGQIENADVAGFRKERPVKYVAKNYTYKRGWNGLLLLGGTLWFANNEKTRQFLDLWIASCQADSHRHRGDQDNLNEICDKHFSKMGLRYYQLPVEYMFEYHLSHKPPNKGHEKDAVIVHAYVSTNRLLPQHKEHLDDMARKKKEKDTELHELDELGGIEKIEKVEKVEPEVSEDKPKRERMRKEVEPQPEPAFIVPEKPKRNVPLPLAPPPKPKRSITQIISRNKKIRNPKGWSGALQKKRGLIQ